MIDDEPDAAGTLAASNAEASTSDALDHHATRAPDSFDPFATRAETDPNWLLSTGPSTSGSAPRYRILRAHARGSLGEVFVAHDEELGREVALKEIQDRHADDPCSRARFLLEAEVTGSLEHPGIIPVYGLGHHPDGRPYYAMRLIRGGSLKEAIDRYYRPDAPRGDPGERALEFRTLLSRFVAICNAIAYAHSRQVLHRDLKPGNVMLGPYGETLVVDWGLAKSLAHPDHEIRHDGPLRSMSADSTSTVVGSVVGTPAFMSPEQAEGDLDRLGPASDIYSLGATLYCVLTGKAPFDGTNVFEILAKVRKGEFPPPRKVRREVPRALQSICLKAMANRPEDRYPTARALAGDVEHWLAGASVSAYPDGLAVRLWRWGRRHPVLTTAALACLFLDLCVLVPALLAYVQTVLHAGSMPRLNMAAGVLMLIPFAGQAGALIGLAAGAIVGGAWRRTLTGLTRGASVGLKVGVPAAIALYLALGAFGIAHPPSWVQVVSPAPSPVPPLAWPRLPGSSQGIPGWIKPGGPVDLATFFHEPPRDRNAAPLYLDAMFEFDERMSTCFSPDEGSRRAAIAGPRHRRLEESYRAWKADPASVDRETLDALLDEYEVGFLKLKVAQRREACVFRSGLNYIFIPHAEAARQVARATTLRAARRLERGEVDLAIDDLDSLLRLARDLRPMGDVILQLVSIATETVAANEILSPILRVPSLRSEQCDRLLEILGKHSRAARDPFLEAYRTECVKTENIISRYVDELVREETLGGSGARNALRLLLGSKLERPYDDPEVKASVAKLEAEIDAQLAKTTPSGFARSTHLAIADFYQGMLGLARTPLLERIEAAGTLAAKKPANNPLLLLHWPDAEATKATIKAIGRSEAERGSMICLVALRRWELAGRGDPTDLGEVVRAAGMANVPVDPFRSDGGPLRLVVLQGEQIVYSIGLDGQDDGGKVDAKQGVEPRGDYLYRIRPTADGR